MKELDLLLDLAITPGNTLIIFDEIQACAEALNSLKYFFEKANGYHVVAAGSLLGVELNKSASFPVGKVNFLDLYPLNFGEFLDALGKSRLRQYIDAANSLQALRLATLLTRQRQSSLKLTTEFFRYALIAN